jgi:hypothetical protein
MRAISVAEECLTIVQPDTVLRWHRMGFRLYWRWKSRSRGGRPKVPIEVRSLIRRMSVDNPLWGAPRIHGELLKLGIEVAQSTVAKYMARRRPGPGQTWKTFLRNHAGDLGAMDFLVVPTINFRLLSVLVILRYERRRLISLSVTDHPTAEWIAQQITEAFPWDEAPDYLIRDRDGAYGQAVTKRLAAMRTRDHPIAARSPWQNGHAERLIGSIRREYLDHMVILGEDYLSRVLKALCCLITTISGRTSVWRRMRRWFGLSSGSVTSLQGPSCAGLITNTAGSDFSRHKSHHAGSPTRCGSSPRPSTAGALPGGYPRPSAPHCSVRWLASSSPLRSDDEPNLSLTKSTHAVH